MKNKIIQVTKKLFNSIVTDEQNSFEHQVLKNNIETVYFKVNNLKLKTIYNLSTRIKEYFIINE